MQDSTPTDGNDGFEIDFWRLIRRRWPLLVFGLSVSLGIATAYQLTARHIFESQMEILVAQRSSELTNRGTSEGSVDQTIVRDNMLATHIELFRSPRIINEAIQKSGLTGLPSIKEAKANNESPLGHIRSNLDVERGGEGAGKEASVLKATFRSTSPADTVLVLQAVYDCYKEYVESQTKNVGAEAAALIQQAQLTNEEELSKATDEYRLFVAGATGLIDGSGKLNSVHHVRVAAIEQELTEIRSQLAYSKARLALISEMAAGKKGANLTDLDQLALLSEKEVGRLKLFIDVSKGDVQNLQFQTEQPIRSELVKMEFNKLLSLTIKEQALASDFGDGHPLVVNVRQEIASIRSFIEKNTPAETKDTSVTKMSAKDMLQAYGLLLGNDVGELNKRQQHLLIEADAERAKAKSVESEFLLGQTLKAKLDRAQSRYDEVIERLQELQLTTEYAGFSTDLLISPLQPQQKAWPNALIVLALGGISGLFFGGGLAVWAEISDQTYRDPADLERSLGAPIIGHVPRFKVSRADKKLAKSGKLSPVCRAAYAPRSIEAEVLRMARTSLMLHAKQTKHKVFLVTSSMPGDGKSTMLANIAISLAQAGLKVLVIDGDMRRPTLHKIFGVQVERGLAEYLQGDCDVEEATVATAQENLDCISHGGRTGSPAELLESYNLERLIEESRQSYDFIFIDSPPLLAVADPLIISTQVDAALLVVRVLKNGRRPVERSREMLVANSVKLAGIVVNGSESGGENFGYGEYVQAYEYGYATEYTKAYSVKATSEPKHALEV